MCTNFIPASRPDCEADLGWPAPTFDYPAEAYVGYRAPIRIAASDAVEGEWREAQFGLLPFWTKDTKVARHTYNARSETVASKPSFRDPWRKGRYALVPMRGFFEPDYETGKAVRWRIERRDQSIFTVAAIWERWHSPEAAVLTSFSLLTINADSHPVMGRFHAPGDEKRSLVVVPPDRRESWLKALPTEAMAFLEPMAPEQFCAKPDPRPVKRSPAGNPVAALNRDLFS